jgi:hypothetical protein
LLEVLLVPMASLAIKPSTAALGDQFCDDVCAICETSYDLRVCDGFCFRSFHADCVEADNRPPTEAGQYWACYDCLHGIHRCFGCKQYGKDDHMAMIPCTIPTCGIRYHKKCLPNVKDMSLVDDEFLDNFVCPFHACTTCGNSDSFALLKCFRCPTAYCNKCAPSSIINLSSKLFVCKRHSVESRVLGAIPMKMIKRLRVAPLRKRCRLPSKFGYNFGTNVENGSVKDNVVGTKRVRPVEKVKDTVNWGDMNTSAALVMGKSGKVESALQSQPGKSLANSSLDAIKERMQEREKVIKRRKLKHDQKEQDEKKQLENVKVYAKLSSEARKIERSKPRMRTAQDMLKVHSKILKRVKGWIDQRKEVIGKREDFLEFLDYKYKESNVVKTG